MFPSESYKKLCIENQEVLREEWEPKVGDIVCDPNDGNRIGILAHVTDPEFNLAFDGRWRYWQTYWPYAKRLLMTALENVTPLFQPRQLIEMLEERGIDWKLSKDVIAKIRLPGQAWADERLIVRRGPDPATALLKAYLEMVKDG